MILHLKHLVSSPIIASAGYLFLVYVPYLYPSHFFPYVKVYDSLTHTTICFFLLILVVSARIVAEFPKTRLKPLDSGSFKLPIVSREWYLLSLFFIYVALIMNILLVINGFLSYDGFSFTSSKHSLENFKGINILSQFYLFFIGPYILYAKQNKLKRYRYTLIFLGIFIFVRSIYYAERLSLLEYILPIALTIVTIKQKKVRLINFVKYFLGVMLFFVLLELTRQFSVQYRNQDVDIWFKLRWTVERFFGYYGDTQNKFYFVFKNELAFETNHYLEWIERIVGRMLPLDFGTQKIIDFGDFKWRDFTNLGGLTITYTDFGLFLGVIFIFFFFFFFFKLWIKLKNGSLYGWSVYPIFFVWIVEYSRYSGIFLTRYMVIFILFNIIYFLYKNAKITKGKK